MALSLRYIDKSVMLWRLKTCLPTINSISTMIRHDIVGVRKEKVILIAPGKIEIDIRYAGS